MRWVNCDIIYMEWVPGEGEREASEKEERREGVEVDE